MAPSFSCETGAAFCWRSRLTVDILRPVLQGTVHSLDYKCGPSGPTVQELIVSGVYTNAINVGARGDSPSVAQRDQQQSHKYGGPTTRSRAPSKAPKKVEADTAIPVIPPFLLRLWAKSVLDDEVALPAGSELKLQVAYALRDFLITGLQWPAGSPAGGHFELYHSGWELLRHLLSVEKKTTIDKHYKGLAIWKSDSIQLRSTAVSYSSEVPCLIKCLQSGWDKQKWENTFQGPGIYVPPAGQSGLDLVTVFESQTSRVATAVENRYTAEGMDNSSDKVDVDHKGELFNEIKAAGALPRLSLLVFISYREMTESLLANKMWAHNNVIIIPKERIRELYGPTLGQRPQFLASLIDDLPPTGSLQDAASSSSHLLC